MLAALPHLGNVNFTLASFTLASRQGDATGVTAQSRVYLEKCAALVGMSADELDTLLNSRENKAARK